MNAVVRRLLLDENYMVWGVKLLVPISGEPARHVCHTVVPAFAVRFAAIHSQQSRLAIP